MTTSSNETFTYTGPNTFFETRGRFAYFKVEVKSLKSNEDVTLSMYNLSRPDISVDMTRKTDAKGVVVFPIGAVCESMISGVDGDAVAGNITVGETSVPFSNIYPIVGYANREIKMYDKSLYPGMPVVVVYPNAGLEQSLFYPTNSEIYVVTQSGESIGSSNRGPIVTFDPGIISGSDLGKPIGIGVNPDSQDFAIKTIYDYCASGVFLKWKDAAGVPYMYRWTQEIETDEMSVNSTYRQLDETLTPFDVHSKTIGKRYTLHSRIVEKDIYNMCRTIIGCQELFMYDPDVKDWVRCSIEDSEIEDSGVPMQDVEIEVVKYEYL